MTLHERQLRILADALLIRDPRQVITALRRKNVIYVDRDGALLFAAGPEWSDEQLVEAAMELFITGEAIN